jgi:hypothetical protein
MGNPERKRPLGRLRGRLEDNIKIYFKEIGWMGMNSVFIWLRTGTSGWPL